MTPPEPAQSPEMQFAELVLGQLPYEPTQQQVQLVAALARFYCARDTLSVDRAFILRGYAGTGKSSLTGALVKALKLINHPAVLLAPTGRAAKVLSAFAESPAYTIHRKIYYTTLTGLQLASNPHNHTLFVVDEASMIGDSESLLSDLLQYVFSGVGNRLLLVGDTAQLPPVGLTESPALSAQRLRDMGLHVSQALLRKTVRQAASSGVLYNATRLRHFMELDPLPLPKLTARPFSDVKVVEQEELEDALGAAYRDDGIGGAILVTRSNKRATLFNAAIRDRILGRSDRLARGELLMVAKNNYFWTREVPSLQFIANGETATIERINSEETRYGLRWADVTIALPYRDATLDVKILLDTLNSESASLEPETLDKLARDILIDPDYAPANPSPGAMRQTLRNNPYYNALQVKYAYAVTCHKAQGGQWPHVFVDLGGIPPESMQLDFYRWLYTAVTRTTFRLYLVNPGIEVD